MKLLSYIFSYIMTAGDDDFCSAGTNSSTSPVKGKEGNLEFKSIEEKENFKELGLIERMTHTQCDRGQGDCDKDDDCFDVEEIF